MKNLATPLLIGTALLAGSTLASADETIATPMFSLSTVQLDGVDAAGKKRRNRYCGCYYGGFAYADAHAEGAALATGYHTYATSYNGSVANSHAGYYSAAGSYSHSTAISW